jgi:hypothetical protein
MLTVVGPNGQAATDLKVTLHEAIESVVDQLAKYDSKADTLEHIAHVRNRIGKIVQELLKRAEWHDFSKLNPPEKEHFDRMTPKLANLKFGSADYQASLVELKPALDHHYAVNSHHPEHYHNGVAGMDVVDLVEMVCDWKAASMRSRKLDFSISLERCFERFKVEPQLAQIIRNTVDRMGWNL